MSAIAFSTISENPIGAESIASPASDLKLEVFSLVTKTHVIEDTASLTISNGINEVIAPINFKDTLALTVSVTDSVTIVYNQVDNNVLKLDHSETITASFKVVDTAPLTIVSFERPPDNEPSEAWREYPGLPIQPIGYSPISGEQLDIIFRTFSDDSQASLDISVVDTIQIIPSSTDSIALIVAAQDAISSTAVYVDQGNLTTVSIVDQVVFLNSSESANLEISAQDQVEQQFNFVDAVDTDIAVTQENSITSVIEDTGNLTTVSIVDQVVFLNSSESVNLEISAQDQVQQVFEFFEVAEIVIENADLTSSTLNDSAIVGLSLQDDIAVSVALDYRDTAGGTIESNVLESKTSNYSDNLILVTEPNDLISMRYYSFDTAVTTINAKTYAKEYTFLQQEFAIDQYELRLSAESSESFRSGAGAPARVRQFWIG